MKETCSQVNLWGEELLPELRHLIRMQLPPIGQRALALASRNDLGEATASGVVVTTNKRGYFSYEAYYEDPAYWHLSYQHLGFYGISVGHLQAAARAGDIHLFILYYKLGFKNCDSRDYANLFIRNGHLDVLLQSYALTEGKMPGFHCLLIVPAVIASGRVDYLDWFLEIQGSFDINSVIGFFFLAPTFNEEMLCHFLDVVRANYGESRLQQIDYHSSIGTGLSTVVTAVIKCIHRRVRLPVTDDHLFRVCRAGRIHALLFYLDEIGTSRCQEGIVRYIRNCFGTTGNNTLAFMDGEGELASLLTLIARSGLRSSQLLAVVRPFQRFPGPCQPHAIVELPADGSRFQFNVNVGLLANAFQFFDAIPIMDELRAVGADIKWPSGVRFSDDNPRFCKVALANGGRVSPADFLLSLGSLPFGVDAPVFPVELASDDLRTMLDSLGARNWMSSAPTLRWETLEKSLINAARHTPSRARFNLLHRHFRFVHDVKWCSLERCEALGNAGEKEAFNKLVLEYLEPYGSSAMSLHITERLLSAAIRVGTVETHRRVLEAHHTPFIYNEMLLFLLLQTDRIDVLEALEENLPPHPWPDLHRNWVTGDCLLFAMARGSWPDLLTIAERLREVNVLSHLAPFLAHKEEAMKRGIMQHDRKLGMPVLSESLAELIQMHSVHPNFIKIVEMRLWPSTVPVGCKISLQPLVMERFLQAGYELADRTVLDNYRDLMARDPDSWAT